MAFRAGIQRTDGEFIVPAGRRAELLAALQTLEHVTRWGSTDGYSDAADMLRDYGFTVDSDWPADTTDADTALRIEWFEYGTLNAGFDELIDLLGRFAPAGERVEWYWEGDDATSWVNRFEHGTHSEYPIRVVVDDGQPQLTVELHNALESWHRHYRAPTSPDDASHDLNTACERLADVWERTRRPSQP